MSDSLTEARGALLDLLLDPEVVLSDEDTDDLRAALGVIDDLIDPEFDV